MTPTGDSTLATLKRELAEARAERDEAFAQQAAINKVLETIGRAGFHLQSVLDGIAEAAARLCNADYSGVLRRDGETYRIAATAAFTPEAVEGARRYQELIEKYPIGADRGSISGRVALESRVVHVEDTAADPEYSLSQATALGGLRTQLGVPLLRDGQSIGLIVVARQRVRAFTERQVELVRTFADQAVIALENARLVTETREALDQQTATAEVLDVINASPGDLAPVFAAILEKAMSLCDAAMGFMTAYDGERFAPVALRGVPALLADYFASGMDQPQPGEAHWRLLEGDDLVHNLDQKNEDAYHSGSPLRRAVVDLGGTRTALVVALRRSETLLGTLTLYRREVRPFTDAQIGLVQSFAAQAVIAMENARLLNELRDRTRDLQESLEYQTATNDVLKVISQSDADLTYVLQTALDTAARLCAAGWGHIFLRRGERLQTMASLGVTAENRADMDANPVAVDLHSTSGRAVLTGHVVHIADIAADPDYAHALTRAAGIRTMLGVPLLRDRVPIGSMSLARKVVKPFTDKQIALVENFAAQAVIAMENARLIGELRAARDDAEAAYRDLQAAQSNLVQAQKMAALGQLTAGIAHEIKNPLNFVNNFASLSVELLDELKETAEPALAALDENKRADVDDTMELLTGNLEKIAEHGKRADNIVKSMLEHSRGVSGERREVDLNSVIEEALNLAYHGARAQDQGFNITLERDYEENLRPIELAPQEMTRVFLNLFGNGFYAANKRARDNADGSFRPVLLVRTREDGGGVEVRVRDNGTGIPIEIKDKLFQPFFTTKPPGEGTGLGLSISYDIVAQQHGGTITVDSEPGSYTEFTIRLPRR